MKIIQVVSSIYNESDGVGASVRGLTGGLASDGMDVVLHCLDYVPEALLNNRYRIVNYPRKSFPVVSIGFSPEMRKGLDEAIKDADIIHSNGLWMMPNIYPEWAIRGTKCKLVVQPHGTLSRWAMKHSWWKKMPLWWLWQKRVLDKAELLVATCEKEYREIRALGYKQPIAIIPIGLEMPIGASRQFRVPSSEFRVGADAQDCQSLRSLTRQSRPIELSVPHTDYHPIADLRYCQCDRKPQNIQKTQKEDLKLATSNWQLATEHNRLRRIVFFGRIHKVKAVDNLVKAWGALHADLPDWELVIAGPDCGAKAELDAIIAEENIPRVRFVGEINGQAKYDFLTDVDVYVLPSHTENFGVTVAEALACGTPTIASQGTPWEGLEMERCGNWVPIGVEPLVDALRELTSLTDEERAAMGQRGIEWIRRDFSWEGIGAKMKAAYVWLLGQGERPEWVRVD